MSDRLLEIKCNVWYLLTHPALYNGCAYLSMLGLKSIYASKSPPPPPPPPQLAQLSQSSLTPQLGQLSQSSLKIDQPWHTALCWESHLISLAKIELFFYSSPPEQNGRRLAYNIFVNENVGIFIKISLKFVLKGTIDNKSALVQVMAWRRTGAKPLPGPMPIQFTDAYMRHLGEMS